MLVSYFKNIESGSNETKDIIQGYVIPVKKPRGFDKPQDDPMTNIAFCQIFESNLISPNSMAD